MERLREYDELHGHSSEWPAGFRLALESGTGRGREWVRFWERVAAGG